jgi:hypothetical protein
VEILERNIRIRKKKNQSILLVYKSGGRRSHIVEDFGVENDGDNWNSYTPQTIKVEQSVKTVKKKNREYSEQFRTENDKEKE